MSNEIDDVERWLMSPDTTIDDLERIANGDDEDGSKSITVRPRIQS